MLTKIQQFFTQSIQAEEQTLEHRLQLASAALLIELMLADNNALDEEKNKVKSLIQQQFTIDEQTVEALMSLAQEELNQSSDLYQFTRLINDHYDYCDKCTLIENLWHIAYADNQLDKYEEHTIRKIAELIYVRHSDFLKTKHIVLNKLITPS